MRLEDIEETYTGPTLKQAYDALLSARFTLNDCELKRQELEQQLQEAKVACTLQSQRVVAAESVLLEAERTEKLVAEWKSIIAKSIPAAPDPVRLTGAALAVTEARAAIEQGALVRRAREHLDEAVTAAKQAVEHKQRAHVLREAAKGTDNVLSNLVSSAGTPLRVEAGRLMVDTPEGPKTFGELSHGRRSRMALAIAIDAVGVGGVICLKQEFWEGVAPAKKLELAQQAREGNVLVLTAQATDDETIVAETL